MGIKFIYTGINLKLPIIARELFGAYKTFGSRDERDR
jgi:hypothetical protein